MAQDMLVQGKQVPKGKVVVSGAKNSATRLLAAALLTEEPVRLRNFPTQLVDAKAKMNFIRELGAQVDIDDVENTVEIMTESDALTQLGEAARNRGRVVAHGGGTAAE